MGIGDLDDEQRRRLARASALALQGAEYADVPVDVEAGLRSLCLGMPDVVERPAWAGSQWRVRDRMFAHVLAVDFPAGPLTVLTFRSAGPEFVALLSAGDPFFRPAWGADAVGLVLDTDVAWDEVYEFVVESYCVVAPKKLVDRLERPTP